MLPASRKKWVDAARGLSMLAIVLFHTEVYLTGTTVIDYGLYVENALVAFVFISGYLFRKDGPFDPAGKLRSILLRLVLPYVLFMVPIGALKALANGEAVDPVAIAIDIASGRASWFITSLALAETVFTLLLCLSCRRASWVLPLSCALLSVVPFCARDALPYPWYADVALMDILFLCMGYLYHVHEASLERFLAPLPCLAALTAVMALKCVESSRGMSMVVDPATMASFPVFIADTTLTTFLLAALSKRVDNMGFVNFVGRNSLAFYFLCGGVPLIIGRLLNLAFPNGRGGYLLVVLAFAMALGLMSLLAVLIDRYLPFMLGKGLGGKRRPVR